MDLGDYVKSELKKGFSQKEIKAALLKAGHKESRIDAALAKRQKFRKIIPSLKSWLVLILVGVLISGGIWMFVSSSYEYRLEQEESQCLSDVKDVRLHILAIKQQNPSLCNELTDKTYRAFCLAEVTGNAAACEKLEGKEQRFCMFPITKDAEDCLALESEPYCQMIIEKSPTPCEQITWLADEKQGCIARANLDETYFENNAYFAEHCKNIALFRTPDE